MTLMMMMLMMMMMLLLEGEEMEIWMLEGWVFKMKYGQVTDQVHMYLIL